jgi:hypothetical protein
MLLLLPAETEKKEMDMIIPIPRSFGEWMPWFRMYGQMMENAVGFSLFFSLLSFLPSAAKKTNERQKRGKTD